jgi:hypothetical protein
METQNDTAQMVTVRSVGIKFGLISALIAVLFFLILAISGQNAFDSIWNYIGLLITVALVYLAHKNFKDSGNGYMSYGQGVGIAFWMALVSLAINFLVTYLYVTFVDKGVLDLLFEKQAEEMAKKGMADDQIDMALGWTRTLFWPMYAVGGLFFGVLVGLIVSIFTQKKNTEPAF